MRQRTTGVAMARYKTLKAVAHNFGHSFTGDMNWFEGDYAMGHTLRQARLVDCPELRVDLLSGQFQPQEMSSPEVEEAVRNYVNWFPTFVENENSALSLISAARMVVQFDHARTKPRPGDPACDETPFVCRVEITDDRGHEWARDQTGFCTPEPFHSSSISWIRSLRESIRATVERMRRRITIP